MRTEWAEAGAWSRSLFVIAATYWTTMLGIGALLGPRITTARVTTAT
jgi:hypothetical protein